MQGYFVVGGDFNIEGGSRDYQEAVKLFGRESVCAPEFKATYSTSSFLTPPIWRDVAWTSNLDHIFTNLEVQEYDVLTTVDISDHLPLHLVTACPPLPNTRGEVVEIMQDEDCIFECSRTSSIASRAKLHSSRICMSNSCPRSRRTSCDW